MGPPGETVHCLCKYCCGKYGELQCMGVRRREDGSRMADKTGRKRGKEGKGEGRKDEQGDEDEEVKTEGRKRIWILK